MSADNWAECPRCIFNDRYEVAQLEHKLNEIYGNVPIQDYEALRNQIEELQYEQDNNRRTETFREDYEFYGAETGTLKISYSGCCTKCGLKLQFEEERDFYKEGGSGGPVR